MRAGKRDWVLLRTNCDLKYKALSRGNVPLHKDEGIYKKRERSMESFLSFFFFILKSTIKRGLIRDGIHTPFLNFEVKWEGFFFFVRFFFVYKPAGRRPFLLTPAMLVWVKV